jgi:hypothetical protein
VKISLVAVAVISSLALNAALGLALLKTTAVPVIEKPVAPPVAESVPLAPKIDAGIWPSLQPDDLPTLIAQLRAAGFPPIVVRAIVSAQLSKLFAPRRAAMDPGADSRPFFKNLPRDAKLQTALRQLDHEEQKMLRSLLGDAAEPDELWSRVRKNRWADGLSPEKAAEVRRIREQIEDQRFAMSIAMPSGLEARAKTIALEKEEHAAIAKILSPQEFEDYALRTSRTANNLRSRLATFDVSEQEFRTLYQHLSAYDERFRRLSGPPTDEESRQLSAAQKQLEEQIKGTLGEERYREFERSTDYNYQQTARLVARLDLPAAAASQVWSVQKEIQERATTLRGDQSLSEEQRNTQLAALGAEASTKITASLGARGFDAYKENGGWWLLELLMPQPGR